MNIELLSAPSRAQALTAARARVGAYPFTTLEPNLGMLDDMIVADIPGLIADAAGGKGLGIKFLRHIERTRVLAHCVSLEHPNPRAAYDVVRRELKAYGRGLIEKRELVILTKTDVVESTVARQVEQLFRDAGKTVVSSSIHNLDQITSLKRAVEPAVRSS